MTNQQLFRVTHKSRGEFAGSFMSPAMSLSNCEALAARIKSDPDCYAVRIVTA